MPPDDQSVYRYGTVVLALSRPMALCRLEGSAGRCRSGRSCRISTVVTLIGGIVLVMWLGEQITARGIGLDLADHLLRRIAAGVPGQQLRRGRDWAALILGVILMAVVVIALAVMERAQRPAHHLSEAARDRCV
jgi:preprotein translocase subunit SecY